MKGQKALSLLQLLVEMAITLFATGVVVPSLLRSDLATSRALAAGSLHSLYIAGVAFSFTNQNIAFAISGAVVGAITALAIHLHSAAPKNDRSGRTNILRPAL